MVGKMFVGWRSHRQNISRVQAKLASRLRTKQTNWQSDYPKDSNSFVLFYYYAFFCARHNHQSVVAAALRVVGNIVTGDDCQTQVSASVKKSRLHNSAESLLNREKSTAKFFGLLKIFCL